MANHPNRDRKAIRLKSNAPTCWEVQQGMISPRDKCVGWRSYDIYDTLPEAEEVARNMARNGGIARVIEQREVAVHHHHTALMSLTDAA